MRRIASKVERAHTAETTWSEAGTPRKAATSRTVAARSRFIALKETILTLPRSRRRQNPAVWFGHDPPIDFSPRKRRSHVETDGIAGPRNPSRAKCQPEP